jgi:hypothetical protein
LTGGATAEIAQLLRGLQQYDYVALTGRCATKPMSHEIFPAAELSRSRLRRRRRVAKFPLLWRRRTGLLMITAEQLRNIPWNRPG